MTNRRQPRSRASRAGRNDPCWCGSGRKNKKCHDGPPDRAPTGPLLGRATAFITQETVLGRRATAEEFERLLAPLAFSDAVTIMSRVGVELFKAPDPPTELDLQVARGLPQGSQTAQRLIQAGERFLFHDRLNTISRESLLHGIHPRRESTPDTQLSSALTAALLAVTDIYHGEGPGTAVHEREAIERTILRQMSRPRPKTDHAIARLFRMFVELPAQHPELLSVSTTFEEMFAKHSGGVTLHDYLAVAFMAFVKYEISDPRTEGDWALRPTYKQHTGVSDETFLAVMRSVSASPDVMRERVAAEKAAGRDDLFDHIPFFVSPFCEVEDEAFVPFDPPLLGERLLGDGVYWHLRDLYTDCGEGSRFGASVGAVLEHHLRDVLERSLPSATAAGRIRGEFKYAKPPQDSPDIGIVEDQDTLVLIEIGVDRPKSSSPRHQPSVEQYVNDIRNIVIKRARQLDRKIRHFRDGLLKYDGISDPKRANVFPVICLLDGFPQAPVVGERIRIELRQAKLLTDLRVAIISAEELEFLSAAVSNGTASFTEILSGYVSSPDRSHFAMSEFIVDTHLAELEAGSVMRDEFNRVARLLGGTLFPEKAHAEAEGNAPPLCQSSGADDQSRNDRSGRSSGNRWT